jgi:hypothetical protein
MTLVANSSMDRMILWCGIWLFEGTIQVGDTGVLRHAMIFSATISGVPKNQSL